MAEPLACANHPKVATILRCSKCGKPICPACVVETPVGLRCRECAQLRRIPTYYVTPAQYVRAVGVAIGLGLALGVGWTLVRSFGFYLSFFAALGVGYAMGELVSFSVNRKRGRGLQVVAAGGVFVSYLVSRMPLLLLLDVPALAVPALQRALADPFGLLALAIAIYLAASRIR